MLIVVVILTLILMLIMYLVVTIVCAACFIVCFLGCIVFWISQRTPLTNCLNWCNTGVLEPWESDPKVDPQEPPGEVLPPGGGLSGGGGVRGRVRHASELRGLLGRGVFARPTTLKLEMAALAPDECDRWESQINASLASCGCKEGGVMMILTTALYLGYSVAIQDFDLAMAFSMVIGGALVGKLVGLLRARVTLGLLVRRLEARCEAASH